VIHERCQSHPGILNRIKKAGGLSSQP